MPYTITYPDSGSDPMLCRKVEGDIETLALAIKAWCRTTNKPIGYIGVLEPVDPSPMEVDQMAWYLKHQPLEPPAGTVVRLGQRTFAVIRSALIAYYHLA